MNSKRKNLLMALPFFVIAVVLSVRESPASSYPWHYHRQASYYYLPGNRTACGQTMTSGSVWVAALKPELAHCHMHVTICNGGRCRHLQVLDRGAWRYDRRDWDLSRKAKQNLSCSDLCTVRWKKGWQ